MRYEDAVGEGGVEPWGTRATSFGRGTEDCCVDGCRKGEVRKW